MVIKIVFRAFFKYAKKFLKSTSDIGPIINDECEVVTGPTTIVDV